MSLKFDATVNIQDKQKLDDYYQSKIAKGGKLVAIIGSPSSRHVGFFWDMPTPIGNQKESKGE